MSSILKFNPAPWIKSLLILVLGSTLCAAQAAKVPLLSMVDAAKKLNAGGYVLMMRHGATEGSEDPPSARLADCASQLQLSAAGKAWASKVGEAFKSAGVKVNDVASSEWCRARQTAELAFGKARGWSALNVYFSYVKRAEVNQKQELTAALTRVKPPGNVVWVSHQVNITTFTGFVPGPDEVLAIRAVAGKPVAEFRFKPAP